MLFPQMQSIYLGNKEEAWMWTDNVTKSCKSNIKTQRKEWKGQQVRPIPYMFCHLRLIMKTEIKKTELLFLANGL